MTSQTRTDAFSWTGTVRVIVPDLAAISDQAVQRIHEVLLGRAPGVKKTPSTIDVAFGLQGESFPESEQEAKTVINRLVEALGIPLNAVSLLRIANNGQIDASIAELPVCVGVGEAAEILGVSKQRVTQLAAENPDFPKPEFRLRATPVWQDHKIRQFAQNRRSRG